MTFSDEMIIRYKHAIMDTYYDNNVWLPLINDESQRMRPTKERHERKMLEDGNIIDIDQCHEFRGLIDTVSMQEMYYPDAAARKLGMGLVQIFHDDLHRTFRALRNERATPIIETTLSEFGEMTHRSQIVDMLWYAKQVADMGNWPIKGRYAVMSPAYQAFLFRSIRGMSMSTDGDLFIKHAHWSDWLVVADKFMSKPASLGTDDHWMYFGMTGRSIDYMGQWWYLEGGESTVPGCIDLNGKFVYGAQIRNPRMVLVTKTEVKE